MSTPEPTPTIYHGQPYAVMPESTLTLCQSRLSLPVRDFGFSLWILHEAKQLYGQDMHILHIVREVKNLLLTGFLRRKISAFITQKNY
jgi:hypothetical protein